MQIIKEPQTIIQNKINKTCFIGVFIGASGTHESGMAVIDSDLNLLRVDKAFLLNEFMLTLSNVVPAQSAVMCVGLPRNRTMINGKWRIESKHTQSLKLGHFDKEKHSWTQRFSDRGSELCNTFSTAGMDVFRYNSYYTKNYLRIMPPFKSRTPAACKYLQAILTEKLGIKGVPTNLIPLPALDAIIGAYISWKIATSNENQGYEQIGAHKKTPIITAIS